MSAVSGKYVSTFTAASHALPQGMHMNADYPLMLPRITNLTAKQVTLAGREGPVTAKIQRDSRGEFCVIAQSSTFEAMFGRKPHRFRFNPFKDDQTEAAGSAVAEG